MNEAKDKLEDAVASINEALDTGYLSEYVEELMGICHRIQDISGSLIGI
jgi:hypothetical protein